MTFLFTAAVTFMGLFFAVPILLALIRLFGWFVVVGERQAKVYMLFGKVLGIIDEPGLYFLPTRLGVPAFIVHWLGRCYTLDLRLDQQYLRSQAVNSEEGAPMGIGIWYEMSMKRSRSPSRSKSAVARSIGDSPTVEVAPFVKPPAPLPRNNNP